MTRNHVWCPRNGTVPVRLGSGMPPGAAGGVPEPSGAGTEEAGAATEDAAAAGPGSGWVTGSSSSTTAPLNRINGLLTIPFRGP